ncbi:MAG: hypothetical protein E3J72_16005 [Planctomycetota bacterium]|nr:MAG: hypothetical protein E3J72_16005 [Planctomycetota bacterium]
MSALISVVAVYLFLSINGPGRMFESLSEEWSKGSYGSAIVLGLIVLFAALLLLIPFISIIRWRQFDENAAKLSVFISTFVLACCYGWLMETYFQLYVISQKWLGMNIYLLLAVISTLSLSLLIAAMFFIWGFDSSELPEFNPGGGISSLLLLVNLILTIVLITGNYYFELLGKSDEALILFNTYFLVSKLVGRKSTDAMITGEKAK